jgi:hypothetical protein
VKIQELRLVEVDDQIGTAVRQAVAYAQAILGVHLEREGPATTASVHVSVTPAYVEAVRTAEAEHGVTRSRPYEARREQGAAVGKAVYAAEPGRVLRATVVLDPGGWSQDGRGWFAGWLGTVHEFLHLLFEATRRERGWPDYRAHLARSLRNQFLTAAELAWEEHQVHLLTNQAALDLKIATGSDGQPVSELHMGGANFLPGVQAMLDRLAEVAAQPYGSAVEAGTVIVPLVDTLIVTLARTLAVHAPYHQTDQLRELLATNPHFTWFIAEDWETLLHALGASRAEGTETIADVFERVLWRAGLDVHQAPQATDLRFVTTRS